MVETHNNGNISLISHYLDTESGVALIKQETFHYSGPKSMIGNFDNGLRNGNWTYWHENGNKRLEGTYLNGTKMGYGLDGMEMEPLLQNISMIIRVLMENKSSGILIKNVGIKKVIHVNVVLVGGMIVKHIGKNSFN